MSFVCFNGLLRIIQAGGRALSKKNPILKTLNVVFGPLFFSQLAQRLFILIFCLSLVIKSVNYTSMVFVFFKVIIKLPRAFEIE